MPLLLVSLAVLLAGPDQRPPPQNLNRFKADLTILCDVTARAGATKIKDASDRADKISDFLAAQDFGDDYSAFFTELSGQAPEEKPSYLLATARLAGLPGCAFAESSRKDLLREWQPECTGG